MSTSGTSGAKTPEDPHGTASALQTISDPTRSADQSFSCVAHGQAKVRSSATTMTPPASAAVSSSAESTPPRSVGVKFDASTVSPCATQIPMFPSVGSTGGPSPLPRYLTTTGPGDSVTLEWITADDVNIDATWYLVEQFHKMCLYEFEHHEVEELCVWRHRLEDGGRTEPYRQCFSFLVDRGGAQLGINLYALETRDAVDTPAAKYRVLAGAARELYADSGCSLISYIVVSPLLRGRGIAFKIVQRAVDELTLSLSRPLNALFIEVAQARDAVEGRFDASARQRIWDKMGFTPLDFDLVHPGRLKGGRYHIAAFTNASGATPFTSTASTPVHGSSLASELGASPAVGTPRSSQPPQPSGYPFTEPPSMPSTSCELPNNGGGPSCFISVTTLKLFLLGLFRGILMSELRGDDGDHHHAHHNEHAEDGVHGTGPDVKDGRGGEGDGSHPRRDDARPLEVRVREEVEALCRDQINVGPGEDPTAICVRMGRRYWR